MQKASITRKYTHAKEIKTMTNFQTIIHNYEQGLITWSEAMRTFAQDDEVPVARLNKYFVYLDDGTEDVLKVAVPAKSEKDAREYVNGNGEVIAIRDITDRYPISADQVAKALINAGFGRTEVDLITRTLQSTEIAD